MSSILEALKKAEQEAAAGRGAGTPWPSSPTESRPYRAHRSRRWIILGLVFIGCVGSLTFWQYRGLRAPEAPLASTAQPREAPAAAKPPVSAPAQKTPPPSAAPPGAPAPRKPPSKAPSDPPVSRVPADQPIQKAAPAAGVPSPQAAPAVQPDRQVDRLAAASPEKPAPRPRSAVDSVDRPATVDENDKTFRNDPRIELQALVWAPEAASRFVVINNRLIKEGGSFDNIVVVRINRDDVLLTEGADRWHERFKIR